MNDLTKSPYRDPRNYGWFSTLVVILIIIALIGLRAEPEGRGRTWIVVIGLMTVFAVVAGRAITGKWRGILIDARYKMSLSRLQMLTWSLVVLSTLLMAGLTNIALGAQGPMEIEVPPGIWVVMGISTATLVASPAILRRRFDTKAPASARKEIVTRLKAQGYTEVDEKSKSVVVRNTGFDGARWGDLLKGEEVGNAAAIDLGKLQMFLFTFVLILAYIGEVYQLFATNDIITVLPGSGEGINTLLGISHTGYLASKTISQSPEEPRRQPA